METTFVPWVKLKQFKAEKMAKVGLVDSPCMFCDLYCLLPGPVQKVHAHAGSDKIYYIVDGAPNDSDAEVVCLVFMPPLP